MVNNFIKYFYNIKTDKIIYNNKYYTFKHNGYLYKLYVYDNTYNVDYLVAINKKMLENTLVSEIVLNRDNQAVSYYNNTGYILIKIYVNLNKKISLEEINYLSNTLFTLKEYNNWGILWSKKIDYLEELINENGKKYPIIVDSFNYFVGMAENAISYYNSIVIENNYKYVISHKNIRFHDTIEALYNPLNIIFDYRVRDLAEYIKNSFFINNKNIFKEINTYLNKNPLSLTDIKLLVARLLYPSFYFELYEDILIDNQDEKIIMEIVSRLNEYEEYLANIISYFQKMYNVDEVKWLENLKSH